MLDSENPFIRQTQEILDEKLVLRKIAEIDKRVKEKNLRENVNLPAFSLLTFIRTFRDRFKTKVIIKDNNFSYIVDSKNGFLQANFEIVNQIVNTDEDRYQEMLAHHTVDTEDWILQINRPEEFIQLMSLWLDSKLDFLDNLWLQNETTITIWYNATISDLLQPELYLQRIIQEAKDPHWQNLIKWQEIEEVEGLVDQKLWVRKNKSEVHAESGFEIQIGISEKPPTDIDLLHNVRYGLSNLGTIYAVQMPLINEKPQNSIEKNIDSTEKEARDLRAWLRDFQEQYPDTYKKIFEMLPESLDNIEHDLVYIYELSTILRTKIESVGKSSFEEWLEENPFELSREAEASTLAQSLIEKLSYIEMFPNKWDLRDDFETLREYELRRVQMKRINPLLASDIERSLRKVSPGALVSLLITIKMMHSIGIREIQLPGMHPYRIHIPPFDKEFTEDLDIDAKIINDKALLIARLQYEIEGISFDHFIFDPTSYATLRLENTITPKREWLQKVYKAIDSLALE